MAGMILRNVILFDRIGVGAFDSADIDSAFLNFRYLPGAFIGDSIAPMTLTVFPLTKALPVLFLTYLDGAHV